MSTTVVWAQVFADLDGWNQVSIGVIRIKGDICQRHYFTLTFHKIKSRIHKDNIAGELKDKLFLLMSDNKHNKYIFALQICLL